MNTSHRSVAWEELVAAEPRLHDLEQLARKKGRGTRSYDGWYRRCKPILLTLVGWSSQSSNPILRSCDAYSTAYRRLVSIYEDAGNDAEARLEREAIAELERLQRARDAKRSGYQAKRRRYTNRQ